MMPFADGREQPTMFSPSDFSESGHEDMPLVAPAKRGINPCLRLYGLGPEGDHCKTCTHLFVRSRAGTYYKCDLRTITDGAATDHRAGWPTCGRYQRRKGEIRAVWLD